MFAALASLRRGVTHAVVFLVFYFLSAELRRTKEKLADAEVRIARDRLSEGDAERLRLAVGNELNLSRESARKLTPERAAEHIARLRIERDKLRQTVDAQRKRIAEMERAAHARNVALDALHYVWCAGGCDDGVHRHDGQGADAIAPEVVDAAIRNTERLVTWSRARVWRAAWMKLTPDLQAEFSRLREENAALRSQVERMASAADAQEIVDLPTLAATTGGTDAGQGGQGCPEDEERCPHRAEAVMLAKALEEAEERKRRMGAQAGRFAELAHKLACRANVAVVVLARRPDGKLFLRRHGDGDDLAQGLWSFPAGILRVEDETIEQAARRILLATPEQVTLATAEPLAITTYERFLDEGTGMVTVYVAAEITDPSFSGDHELFFGPSDPLPPEAERAPFLTRLLAMGVDPWTAHQTLRASTVLARHVGEQPRAVDLDGAWEIAARFGASTSTGSTIARVTREVERLRAALNRDKTGMAAALLRIRQLTRAGIWTGEDLDHARAEEKAYSATLHHLLPEVEGVAIRALRDSGSLATAAFRGDPLTPDAPMSVEQALAALFASPERLTALTAAAWQTARTPEEGVDPREETGMEAHPVLAWEALSPAVKACVVKMVTQLFRVALGMIGDGTQLALFAPPPERAEDLAERLVTFGTETEDAVEGVLDVAGIALLTATVPTGEALRDALRAALAQAIATPGGSVADAPTAWSPVTYPESPSQRTMGLWRYHGIEGGKYLVRRRDGSRPGWPYFVLGAKDPAAGAGLRAYAEEAARKGFDAQYVIDVQRLAAEFEAYRRAHGTGDPDAPPARPDDPATVAEMVAVASERGGS